MSYRVMARARRPEVFGKVVAQEHIVKTLQNAIRAGRVAQAYLFSGPRGTGKTTTARLLAKALNCEHGPTPEPCGECAPCKAIADGKSLDVLEIDGASNRGIEEIRQLREEVGYAASKGKHKVYIIDEVHMLTTEAFNALLKTLEEPPPHVVFVFATTEPHKVPETILSRCQRYNFRRIPTEDIVGQLREIVREEGLDVEEEALYLVARKADGAMRDALSLLDQMWSFSEGAITAEAVRDLLGLIPRDLYFELTQAVLDQDGAAALHVVARVMDTGGDVGEFTAGLLEHVRHLLVTRISAGLEDEDLPEADRARYEKAAGAFQADDLLQMLQAVSGLELNLGRVSDPRFWLELTVLKLVKMASSESLQALLERLDRLEGLLRASGGKTRRTPPEGGASRSGVGDRVAPPRGAGGRAPGSQAQGRTEPSQEGGRTKPSSDVPQAQRPSDPEPPEAQNPPAVAPPAAGGGALSLEAVRAGWDGFVQVVKTQKISVGTFLAEGQPVALTGGRLVVAFKPGSAFHANQVRRNRETVETVAAEVFQTALRVECRLQQEGTSEEEGAQDRPEADERVQIALRIFDGEVLRR